MHWFRKAIVSALLIGCGVTASAQEKDRPPAGAISLGQPTPLAAFRPGAPAMGQTSRETPSLALRADVVPRPSVVRGALPYFDDEPKNPLAAKELEPSVLPPLFPILPPVFPVLPPPPTVSAAGAQPVQTAQPAEKDGPKVIDVDKDGKVTVVPEPPRFQQIKAKAAPAVVSEPTPPADEHVIIVDESGRPLWDGGSGAPPRFYAQSEYLLWWTRGMHLPPLVITDSPATPLATRGILGNGSTQLLYGDNTTSSGPNSGGRFTLGYALDSCGIFSLEGTFFFLGRNNDGAAFNSNQYPVLGRPFIDLNDGIVNRELTTSPNQPGAPFFATGGLSVATTSDLFGAEANLKALLWSGCNYQINGLLGFRYLDLSESVRINESSTQGVAFADVDASIRPGDLVSVFDNFATHNRFYGGQIGAAGAWDFGRWNVEGCVKLGFGVTQQTVDIDGGQNIVSLDGRVQSFRGGLYAVPSNIGSHTQNQFGFVPEVGLKLNYQLTEHISLFVGYDFLFWSSVLRPGDQIDQVLDLNQVPNSGRPYPPASQVRPLVPFQASSYWAQGVNAGVLFRY